MTTHRIVTDDNYGMPAESDNTRNLAHRGPELAQISSIYSRAKRVNFRYLAQKFLERGTEFRRWFGSGNALWYVLAPDGFLLQDGQLPW